MADHGPIRVVAAVVTRDGRLLVGRRPADKRHGGLWEIPGGKLREGESLLDAARRELDEELSLTATGVGATLAVVRDGDSPFVIEFVEVEATGTPRAHEHDDIAWLSPEDLSRLPLAPADAEFVSTLLGRDA